MGARLGRRRLLHGIAASAALAGAGQPLCVRAEESGREAMPPAALAFLGALDSRRAGQAGFQFAHAERLNWHYVPRRREGLSLKEMAPDARVAAHALLQAGLSAAGQAKAQNNANHIHSVWHDPRRDFGADLLGLHYLADRHHA